MLFVLGVKFLFQFEKKHRTDGPAKRKIKLVWPNFSLSKVKV